MSLSYDSQYEISVVNWKGRRNQSDEYRESGYSVILNKYHDGRVVPIAMFVINNGNDNGNGLLYLNTHATIDEFISRLEIEKSRNSGSSNILSFCMNSISGGQYRLLKSAEKKKGLCIDGDLI